jgi:uncharacterized protein (DUF2267 family)
MSGVVRPRLGGNDWRREGPVVRYDEFLAKVRDRGEYADQQEAERITRTVLGVLACRLNAGGAKDLAAQLPRQAAAALASAGPAEAFGVQEFLRRVAAATGASEKTAEWGAGRGLAAVIAGREYWHTPGTAAVHAAMCFLRFRTEVVLSGVSARRPASRLLEPGVGYPFAVADDVVDSGRCLQCGRDGPAGVRDRQGGP